MDPLIPFRCHISKAKLRLESASTKGNELLEDWISMSEGMSRSPVSFSPMSTETDPAQLISTKIVVTGIPLPPGTTFNCLVDETFMLSHKVLPQVLLRHPASIGLSLPAG
jgi:hypothetical protein